MPAAAPPGGRATLDFFAAQAHARRRTALLVVSFALALIGVVALVYAALFVATVALAPRALLGAAAGGPPGALFFQPGLLVAAAAAVVTLTGAGGAYHAVRISSGGGDAVAELLGGTPVDRATAEPGERRLVNVAEEMAIAAGLPVPGLYVLQREPGINAFAAGYTPGHSVVAVTRGALERLTRDELQGVVAHELSHVLNGDTRIDLRLMEAVGGLSFLSLVGRLILENTPRPSRSRDDGRGAFVLVGLALVAAGAFGALCGKLVRFAVARQREWLADASAVQFTRNPDGLAGALRKIALEGSAIESPHALEAAHLFFASSATGFFSELFSTHPPIVERIRRIAPFAAAFLPMGGRRGMPPHPGPLPEGEGAGPASTGVSSARLASGPSPAHIAHAAALLDRFPAPLAAAAREPYGARAIACALLVGDAPGVRAGQLEVLGRDDAALRDEVKRLLPAVGAVARADRMALLGVALPALDGLSRNQGAALGVELRALAAADGTVTPFELAVRRIVLRRLARDGGAPPRPRLRTVDEAEPECLELLSNLAWIGGRDEAAAQAALDAGAGALGVRVRWRLLPRARFGLGRLDVTLTRLDEAAPEVKARLLTACVATALADTQVTADEAELIRAIAAALGLAMPPILRAGAPAERGAQASA